ncbi:hypothetical protein CC1G_09811 [Coprinopsis cinerea okayama7|uniref:Uncharacterized protein n=1 Tax=Coprinopsis cinerea (strain Okayama-7 / 130 / ATCC MYA-4618 / FGSC 9003) TaxID=240176 RepID=A8NMB7_COPC7|nr:hypothetical protein CC1G_09811 [Coprinopsis cinerea okayama7\|eukprot:XP_001834884.2 hypothetical protein CC1G_09811 [Coprinopsis cinerea okayama7\
MEMDPFLLRTQAHILGSIWMDLLVYGLYVPFYLAATYIWAAKPTTARIPSTVFFLGNTILFILGTIHVGINCHRLIQAWGYMVGPDNFPLNYIQNAAGWDNWAHTVLMCLMPWFTGALITYRTYLVWDKNIIIVLFPIIFHLWNLAFGAVLLHWFRTQFTTYDKILPWIDSSYPLGFCQFFILTSLITYKSIKDHKANVAAGVPTSTGFTLFNRIFWDSAALYTIVWFMMVPLYFKMNQGQFILQAALQQIGGIIVSIQHVRVHFAGSKQVLSDVMDRAPVWLNETAVAESKSSSNDNLEQKV